MKIIALNKAICFLTLLFVINSSVNAQKTNPSVIKDFMDKRFGMFVHWGPVSLRGTEIGWSRGNQVPVEDYDNLYNSSC